MSKSIKIFAFYVLLIVFVQSLSSFDTEKDPFNQIQTQFKSNELNEYTDIIEIKVKSEDNQNLIVGFEGVLCLKAEFNHSQSNLFNPETIEEETKFELAFTDLISDNKLQCRLWMTTETIYLFCDSHFEEGSHSILFTDKDFDYKSEYQIKITFDDFISFEQSNMNIPFIYSYEQKISLDENESPYELKFKIQTYNKEILYIYGKNKNYGVLEDCENNSKEITCKISKEKIEEILILKNESFKIGAMNDTLGLVKFDCVSEIIITITYEIDQKEDIYINLEELVGRISETNTPVALKSNVTDIPNFISGPILPGIYFKKTSGKPLMLYLQVPFEVDDFQLESSPNETTFKEIHYKYNFRVQPYQFNETITIRDSGTDVLLAYPENIAFDSDDSKVIRYIMAEPSYAYEIKLNPDSKSELECKDLNEMKICELPESHFTSKKSGYYNTYHKNHEENFNIYYDAPSFNISFPKADNITKLHIEYEDNKNVKYIGYQGILNFVLDYNDNESNIFNASDIEKETAFNTTINAVEGNDNIQIINVTCKLWKPIDENLNMFCKLSQNLTYGAYCFNLSSSTFKYYDREFEVIQNADDLYLFQMNETVPFLYSGKQVLNIDEKTKTYDLKFKIGDYHNEYIVVQKDDDKGIVLDDCNIQGEELICKMEKDIIEEYAQNNGEKLSVFYSMLQSEDFADMQNLKIFSIYGIYINYLIDKENITVEIKYALEKDIDTGNFIAYGTNVKDISNVYTKRFTLNILNYGQIAQINCSMKKTVGTNLLMICKTREDGEFSLVETDKPIELKDINIKYNFIIQPIKDTGMFRSSGIGSVIVYNIPKVLDFTLNDPIIIDYSMTSSEKSIDIKLNPDGDKLECEDIKGVHKRCTVPKSHFSNKNSGYYYTHHLISASGSSVMFYESSPIKVILPNDIYISIKKEDNENIVTIGEDNYFALVTDYYNKDKIFDSNDKIDFNGTFTDMNYKYDASCNLWIPNDDKIRIFCKLNESFILTTPKMYLQKALINYKNYTITIEQNELIEFKQYFSHIPFLYSDKQTINIDVDQAPYELKFKIQKYNNDLLYIYGSNNNYAILDNCQSEPEVLTCKIEKEKIESILTENNEQFKIGAINDTIGLIPLEHILNITIKYENVQKEYIIIQLTKIVGGITEVGTPFAYETNITDFPSFISQKFEKIFYIKKINGRPLMIFCDNPEETDKSPLKNNSQKTVIENAHYKYNFTILPHEISDSVSIKEIGSNILLAYPEELNYNSGENLTIWYIMTNPILASIKLNLNSKSDLKCEDGNMMLKCIVPKSHFRERLSGHFSTYHLNHENNYNIYYDSPLFNVILPPTDHIELNIEDENNRNTILIGLNGIINLVLDYNDNETNIFNASDIEELSIFNTTLEIENQEEVKSVEVTCRLWKPIDAKLNMFCTINTTFTGIYYYFKLSSYNFEYKKIKVAIISNTKHLHLNQIKSTLPFLYSSKKVLNIDEKTDIYELRYKIGAYNNELLLIPQELGYGRLILDKCSEEGKELVCKITKAEIEEYFLYNKNGFHTHVYKPDSNYEEILFGLFSSNGGIYINYLLDKKDIYVEITKLVDSAIDKNNLIAYETNVTDIANVNSEFFDIILIDGNLISCFLKKTEGNPSLLMICQLPNNQGESFSLGEIKDQIDLKDINIKYNFHIIPVKNEEQCAVSGEGVSISFNVPRTLDFTSKDSFTIDYIMDNPENERGIRLNPEGNALACTIESKTIKRCTVSIDHFKDKKSGYYFTHHLNHLDNTIIYHEATPINVILPEVTLLFKEENNKKQINIGKNERVFALVSNYNDTEKNIFNKDEDITFDAELSDINDHSIKYNIKCRLWKPNNDYIRIICNMKDDLTSSIQNLTLSNTSFVYNNRYIIYIEQDKAFQYQKLDSVIPFLYSDRQGININNDTLYVLQFKSDVYENNKLYIYGSNNNYASLDSCEKKNEEVECKITKEKILEILTSNGEEFKIGAIDDNVGVILLDQILNITINIDNVEIEDIYLKITRTIGGITELGTPFAWETNITDFPTFISQKFNDFGYFKKVPGRPLLFIIDYPQEIEIDTKINYTEELKIENMHYKYNFRVQPCSFDVNVSINGTGTNVLLTYPQKIYFSPSDETQEIIIEFIADKPELMNNIKLSPNSESDLICENLIMMKKCTLPKSHFVEKKSGYFNIYHLNHESNYNIYYDSSTFDIVFTDIELYINEKDNKRSHFIGFNGMFKLVLNLNDTETNIFNASDLEEKSVFNTTITINDIDIKKVSCFLWKPIKEKLNMICKLNNTLKDQENKCKISLSTFDYNDKKVRITSNMNNLFLIQINATVPFLYSDKQELNIDDKDIYELKYKIGEYHNEILYKDYRFGGHIFDKCSQEGKELICKLKKSEIEEFAASNGKKISISYYNPATFDEDRIEMNSGIYVNYTFNKQDIYVEITKLVDSAIDENNLIAYETNVTEITNVITKEFGISLSDGKTLRCVLKKSENFSCLLMLCELPKKHEDTFSLGEIKNQIELKEEHIKYNFYILPVKNEEKCQIGGSGAYIMFSYPKTLDFTSKDSITIDFLMENPEKSTGIKLNPEGKELDCINGRVTKRCTVNKSHFENNKNGYYFTHHLNHLNNSIIFHEVSPIHVTLQDGGDESDTTDGSDDHSDEGSQSQKEDEPTQPSKVNVGIIVGSVLGGVALIAAIVIIILVVRKKKANSGGLNGTNGNILPNSGQVELIEGDKFE